MHAVTIREDAEFARLMERQWRFVFRVAYAVLLNPHDAEDAVQETFLKLYRNRGWQKMENERAFLARVGWRIAVDRRSRSVRAATEMGGGDGSLALTRSQNPNPEEELIQGDNRAILHTMIDALPEELRVPLVLSSSDELNSREIGRIMGLPEGTIRTRLQRARQLLRQKFEAQRKSQLHAHQSSGVQNA